MNGEYNKFLLGAARHGDEVFYSDSQNAVVNCKFIGISTESPETAIVELVGGPQLACNFVLTEYLMCAPICYIDGKPAYNNDIVCDEAGDKLIIQKYPVAMRGSVSVIRQGGYVSLPIDSLHWNKQKMKMSGWITIYSDGTTSDILGQKEIFRGHGVVDCVEIHWEE